MRNTLLLTAAVVAGYLFAVACGGRAPSPQATAQPQPTQQNPIVLMGDSFATPEEARSEVNLAIQNAAAAGCEAISVGGLGASGGELGSVYAIPALVTCPAGVKLLPTGAKAP